MVVKSNNLLHTLWTAFFLFRITLKDRSESLIKLSVDIFIFLARFGSLIWLYYYLFEWRGGEINGVTWNTVVWSMFMYFTFMNINPRGLSEHIQKDLKSGQIETHFSKPFPYIFNKTCMHLGIKITSFVICIFLGTILLYFSTGFSEYIFTWTFALTLPFVLIFCFVISFLLYSILGYMAFWIEDVSPLRWILDKAIIILGGAYFPVALFPDTLKTIATYSPFGASQFLSHMPDPTWSQVYLKMIGIQAFWVVVLLIVFLWVQKKAFKNVFVNGG